MQSFAHFSLFCALNLRVMKKNIAIFASGSGSNTENIIRYFRKNEAIQVSLVLSNRSDAYVLERAHRLGVPCNVFPKEDWMAGDEILAVLQEYHIDFVVLAGFLVRVPDLLLHAYPNKIINISYFKLKTVTLGYTLPESVVKKLRVNSLRVYVSADNLLTLTKYSGYDPETSFSGSPGDSNYGVDFGLQPVLRTFIFGLNLNF